MLVFTEEVINGLSFGFVMFTMGLAIKGFVITGFSTTTGWYIIVILSEAFP